MSTVWNKLNLKDQGEILVINAPPSFEPELATLSDVAIRRDPQQVREIAFALAFVTEPGHVDALAPIIAEKTPGDAVVWFAYIKQSSKQYRGAMHRDLGWEALKAAGFRPVRQVAIDADWSAVRFRRTAFVSRSKRDARSSAENLVLRRPWSRE